METTRRERHTGSARSTELQAALVGLDAQLEAWEARFEPRVYVSLLEIHGRRLEARKARPELRRWIAA